MQVICTTHENFSGKAIVDDTTPAVGEIVTVNGERVIREVDCYSFVEYSTVDEVCWFDKRNYSPLSDIDETELVNDKEELHA